MNITVHRGTNEIGAACVEIESETTRIVIDAGLPLDDSPATLPPDIDTADAILISHSHQDHYGLLEQLKSDVPVYMGKVAQALVEGARIFQRKEALCCNFKPIEAWKPFVVGDMKITPYLVDHSAPDAFAFLVESAGKTVFYSGDFRNHGRKGEVFENLLKKPPTGVDVLLLEGTMLERDNSKYPSEDSVEEGMFQLLHDKRLALLMCSGQNVDRLVSAYRASCRAKRFFVVDIYTAWILEVLGRHFDTIPRMEWDRVRVLTKGRHGSRHYATLVENPDYFVDFVRRLYSKTKPAAIDYETLGNEPDKYFVKTNDVLGLLQNVDPPSAVVIYSMWKGYLSSEGSMSFSKTYAAVQKMENVDFEHVHTSGHATLSTLKAMTKAISPKYLVPIHTEGKNQYVEHFSSVKMLEDGEAFQI